MDGATARLDVDLTHLLPGELEGLVVHNGAPLAQAEVGLTAAEGEGARIETARTDVQGRFRARLRPGVYRLAAHFAGSDGVLRAPGSATVVRGQRAAPSTRRRSRSGPCRRVRGPAGNATSCGSDP